MTQAVAIQMPTPPGTAPPTPNMTSGEVAEDSPFAQLLMAFGQTADSGGTEPMLFTPADTPSPSGEKVQPTATEAEQMMALLGLPILPSSPLPTLENKPPAQTSMSEAAPITPTQVAILPDVVTNVVPYASVQTSQPPLGETTQQALASDAFGKLLLPEAHQPEATPIPDRTDDLPLTARVTLPPLDATSSTAGNLQVPLRTEAEPVVTEPSSVKGLHTGAGDSSRLSSNSAAAVQNTMDVLTGLQRGTPAQSLSDTERERREHAPTAQVTERTPAKKSRLTLAEHPSTARPIPAAPEGVPVAEFASALHRASAHPSSPIAEASSTEIVRQVVDRIEAMTHQPRADSVTLQLEPEHLGKLRVTISVSDGTIHTHIVADNHAVRQMLESNSTLLQQALQERGLHLGALQVSVQGDGRQFHLNQPYTPQRPAGGWLEASAGAFSEANFVHTTAGGVNLLV